MDSPCTLLVRPLFSKTAQTGILELYLDFILLRIGLHAGSLHFAAEHQHSQHLEAFALTFPWRKPVLFHLQWADTMFAARGLLAAATDTNFCAFSLTEHFREEAESALLSLANARPDLKLLRLLQYVLASLEDLEIILNGMTIIFLAINKKLSAINNPLVCWSFGHLGSLVFHFWSLLLWSLGAWSWSPGPLVPVLEPLILWSPAFLVIFGQSQKAAKSHKAKKPPERNW